MNKKQLFKKYSIDESHNVWQQGIDSWYSVEIYRLMHDGQLPPKDDMSTKWVVDFLDKMNDMPWWVANVMSKPNWGSYYLTAKRMLYQMHEQILKEINASNETLPTT